MSYSGSGDTGGGWRGGWRNDGGNVPPHAFDPVTQPELFRGVATRRVFAFLIDLVVLTVPVILGYLFIAVFGIITLGLGWMLFWLAWPATVIWAVVYYGASLGGPHSATLGMRVMDLELRTWYGAPGYFVLGAMHAGAVLGVDLVPDAARRCWSACSTTAAGCCTISSWEPWSSTARCEPRSPSRRAATEPSDADKPIDGRPPRRDAPGCPAPCESGSDGLSPDAFLTRSGTHLA